MTDKWFVRGVACDLTKAAASAAKSQGVTMGRWVSDAVRAHLNQSAQPTTVPDEVAGLRQRIEALEKAHRSAAVQRTRKPSKPPHAHADLPGLIASLTAAGKRPRDIVDATGAGRATVYRIQATLKAKADAVLKAR